MKKIYPTPEPRACPVDGAIFTPSGWEIANGRGIYCSKKCSTIARATALVKKCELCGKEMILKGNRRNQRFHRACFDEYQKLQRPWVNCAFPGCNNKFQVMPWELERGYPKTCEKHRELYNDNNYNRGHFKNGKEHPLWNGGISFGKYCPKFRDVRPRVREFFEYKCMMPGCNCGGFTKDSKPQPVCHHVYYQKEACCYHTEDGKFVFDLGKYGTIEVKGDPTKFVTLCGPAHSKTNKDRLYWAKYFENLINTKYGGKSYFTEEEYRNVK